MKLQFSAVVLVAAAAVIVSIIQLSVPFQVSPTVIRGDGVAYYAWLRSVLIDHDVDFQNEYEHYDAILSDSARPMSSSLLDGPSAIGKVLLSRPQRVRAIRAGTAKGFELQ